MGRENCSTRDPVRLPYELVWNRGLGGRGEDNPKQLSKMKNKPWDSGLDQEGPKQVDETDFCAVFRAKEDWVELRNDWGWKDGAVWVKLECKQGWGRGEGPLSASHTLGRLWGRWALDWAWKRELDTAVGDTPGKGPRTVEAREALGSWPGGFCWWCMETHEAPWEELSWLSASLMPRSSWSFLQGLLKSQWCCWAQPLPSAFKMPCQEAS